MDYLEKTYFIEVRLQFGQAFWSILNNHAPIDYSDSRGDKEFVGRRTEMREVGRKRTSLGYTAVWQDFLNFNVININVRYDT